jgi:hypothetical protein
LLSSVRLLGNCEAFHDMQANCQSVERDDWPLDAKITEGLFSGSLMLGERAVELSQSLPDRSDANW